MAENNYLRYCTVYFCYRKIIECAIFLKNTALEKGFSFYFSPGQNKKYRVDFLFFIFFQFPNMLPLKLYDFALAQWWSE